jgi:hypothetical protein
VDGWKPSPSYLKLHAVLAVFGAVVAVIWAARGDYVLAVLFTALAVSWGAWLLRHRTDS